VRDVERDLARRLARLRRSLREHAPPARLGHVPHLGRAERLESGAHRRVLHGRARAVVDRARVGPGAARARLGRLPRGCRRSPRRPDRERDLRRPAVDGRRESRPAGPDAAGPARHAALGGATRADAGFSRTGRPGVPATGPGLPDAAHAPARALAARATGRPAAAVRARRRTGAAARRAAPGAFRPLHPPDFEGRRSGDPTCR
jgi:hypothetical protein